MRTKNGSHWISKIIVCCIAATMLLSVAGCNNKKTEQNQHPMNEECLICGAPLEYLEQDTLMECVLCHKQEASKTRCRNGHYVCNECHMAGMDSIIALCMAETSTDPICSARQQPYRAGRGIDRGDEPGQERAGWSLRIYGGLRGGHKHRHILVGGYKEHTPLYRLMAAVQPHDRTGT